MSISKNYTPADIEDKWYQRWIEAGVFHATPDHRQPYTITIPPPNVTGILHMGHILNNTIQDVLIRRKRMQGFNACWVPGTDHASIATEAKVVQMLREQGIRKADLSREAFLEHAYAWKEKYGGIILQQLRKLGASCDWERTAFTMDAEYSDAVIQVFCDLYDKGYIYRALRMVNWDPQAQTTVSDEEVIYKETQGMLYHVRYPLTDDPDEYVTIATTRPETIIADTAVAINPGDPRFTHLHGRRVRVPLVDREVPIILDDYVAVDFGTGCLKVTPAHDPNDYEIGQRHGLAVIDVLNPDGTINGAAGGLYEGMDRFALRKQIVKDLDAAGLLVRQEPYKNTVGHSERTDVPIEPRLSLQWFLDMQQISKPALQAVLDGEVELIPGKFVNTYKHWMENVRDWCLSRQLWWGHRIPVYYIAGREDFVVAPTAEAALAKARDLTGNPGLTAADLHQDEDVLDTWASSWLWPIQVFNGITRPGNPEASYFYPTDTLVTAPEILFFWVARMIIAGYEYEGKKPFSHVYLTGIVRDDKRRKMSKSLGNSPDPLDLIAQYGADGVRMGMLLASPAGNDLLYKESLVEQGRNFANKIWNAFRLVKGWEQADTLATKRDSLALAWMQARIDAAAWEIEDHFSKFRLSDALMSLYRLIWDDFCAWFLEMVKPEFGSPIPAETYAGVVALFEQNLRLLHPFMPFITEELWHSLRDRTADDFICIAPMVEGRDASPAILAEMEQIKETITAVRAFRSEKGIPTKDPIDLFILTTQPAAFETYHPLLERFLNTRQIAYVQDKVEGAGSLRVGAHELFVPLGQVDVAAERQKLQQEIDYLEGFRESVLRKLSNEKFVANAPEQVVAVERKKQTDAETKLELLRRSLAELG
ncbi:MAG: valine--tRNA ligase [Bacteroidia bacterium]